MEELYIIVNEKIYNNKNNFFCENKDIQSIVNFLASKYNLFLISRNSKSKNHFKLSGVHKILNFNLLRLFFLGNFNKNKKKILIISITPFNFLIFILFKLFYECKFYLYLRSNGYEEYEYILGKHFVWIYDIMFRYMTKSSEVITCHRRLYKKKCHILSPSELTNDWNKRIKKNYLNNNHITLLYVGRFKVEKGIYSLIDIFSTLPKNIKLTLVGNGDLFQLKNNNIHILNFTKKENELIDIYDSSNIVILPSYTEAHPKVIDEALSRLKPVIIFNEIKYVINGRIGVFSIKRNSDKLKEMIYHIINNYNQIRANIKKNKLPTKFFFLDNLAKIISSN